MADNMYTTVMTQPGKTEETKEFSSAQLTSLFSAPSFLFHRNIYAGLVFLSREMISSGRMIRPKTR